MRDSRRFWRGTTVAFVALVACLLLWTILRPARDPHLEQASKPLDSSPGRQYEPTPATEDRSSVESTGVARESQEDPRISIATIDNKGAAIVGAQIAMKCGDVWEKLGSTNDGGTLVYAGSPCDETILFVAVADGFARTSIEVEPGTADVLIELDSEGVIRGFVEYLDGTRSGSGVRVLAFEASNFAAMNAQTFSSLVSGYPAADGATTDSSGNFEIRGVRVDREYRLVAGGGEGVTSGAAHYAPIALGDGPPVRVVVGTLFGAVVSFFDERTGAPLRCSEELSTRLVATRFPKQQASMKLHSPAVALADAEVGLITTDTVRPAWTHFMVGESLLDTGFDVPLLLTATYPGYVDTEVEVWLRPYGDPGMHQRIPLIPESDFGLLEIVFSGSATSSPGDPLGRLVFFDSNGNRICTVTKNDIETSLFDGFPTGAYSCRFIGVGGFALFPPTEALHFVVAADQKTVIEIDVGRLDAEVIITDPEGLLRGDSFQARLVGNRPGGPVDTGDDIVTNSFRFNRDEIPRRIAGLPAGRFLIELQWQKVSLRSPFVRFGQLIEVELLPGEQVRISPRL